MLIASCGVFPFYARHNARALQTTCAARRFGLVRLDDSQPRRPSHILTVTGPGGELQTYEGETDLFIHPGYRFRVVNSLMTNFHLPRTTLLVLVRTFGGEELIRRGGQQWHLLCKCRGKLQSDETVTLMDRHGREGLHLTMVKKLDDGSWIAAPESDDPPLVLLDRLGRVPLPRYIRRGEMEESDRSRYQTVFAKNPGSVAAPTAGLHFSQDLIRRLARKDIQFCYLTLHVGLGTFQPMTATQIEAHHMQREWGQIDADAVRAILAARHAGRRIVAVGSTCVRLLESASAGGELQTYEGETDLFIHPGYRFRVVNSLMTNFHLPRTTLLVLVRTFGGEELIRRAYDEAIRERYRFYSYGDAMLIL